MFIIFVMLLFKKIVARFLLSGNSTFHFGWLGSNVFVCDSHVDLVPGSTRHVVILSIIYTDWKISFCGTQEAGDFEELYLYEDKFAEANLIVTFLKPLDCQGQFRFSLVWTLSLCREHLRRKVQEPDCLRRWRFVAEEALKLKVCHSSYVVLIGIQGHNCKPIAIAPSAES